MSFDQDPNDAHERFLLYHAESDCVFEVFSRSEMYYCVETDSCVENVTNEPIFEQRFKNEKNKKGY